MTERELAKPDLQKIYQDTLRSLNGEFIPRIDFIETDDPDAFPGDVVADALNSQVLPAEKRAVIVSALEDFYDNVINEAKPFISQNQLANYDAAPNDLQERLTTLTRVLDLAHPPEVEQRAEQNFEYALGLLEKEHGRFVDLFILDTARVYVGYTQASNYVQLWEQAGENESLRAYAILGLVDIDPSLETIDQLLERKIVDESTEDSRSRFTGSIIAGQRISEARKSGDSVIVIFTRALESEALDDLQKKNLLESLRLRAGVFPWIDLILENQKMLQNHGPLDIS